MKMKRKIRIVWTVKQMDLFIFNVLFSQESSFELKITTEYKH